MPRLAGGTNPHTHMRRIVRRAGLDPWPKLFQNLRSTRQTELAADHPAHVVCAWMGNSRDVAAEHYLQVTGQDFARAGAGGAVGAAGLRPTAPPAARVSPPHRPDPAPAAAGPPAASGKCGGYSGGNSLSEQADPRTDAESDARATHFPTPHASAPNGTGRAAGEETPASQTSPPPGAAPRCGLPVHILPPQGIEP